MKSFQNIQDLPIEGIIVNLLIPGLGYFLIAGLAYYLWYKKDLFKRKSKKLQKVIPSFSTIRLEIIYSIRSFLIWMLVGVAIIFAFLNDATLIYVDANKFGYGYLLVSFLIIVVIHDTYFYWMHRLMHHPKIFKYTHRLHHKFSNPTPWSAFAFDPIEAFLQAAYFPILVFVIPFHWAVLAAFLIYMIVMNVIGHLGFEIFSQKIKSNWIGKWSNTASDHNLHHLKSDCNYGLYFRFWDILMNTNSKLAKAIKSNKNETV